MVFFDEYVKGILKQVLDSYQILLELEDKPGALKIIKNELLKINGFLHVIVKKINSSKLWKIKKLKLKNNLKNILLNQLNRQKLGKNQSNNLF